MGRTIASYTKKEVMKNLGGKSKVTISGISKGSVYEPTECPGCGAKVSESSPMEGDSFSIITSFKCGAKTRWRSIGASGCNESGGGFHEYSSSLSVLKECRKGLPAVLGAAMEAHPKIRMGQLVWLAVNMVSDDTNVFRIDDDDLATGLGMVAREKNLPKKIDDKSSRTAKRIQSYLTRKIDGSLDKRTVDHIAKMIREDQDQGGR